MKKEWSVPPLPLLREANGISCLGDGENTVQEVDIDLYFICLVIFMSCANDSAFVGGLYNGWEGLPALIVFKV